MAKIGDAMDDGVGVPKPNVEGVGIVGPEGTPMVGMVEPARLNDSEGLPMLESDREPKLVAVEVGGTVMFTYWNPEEYPVTFGRSVGVGYAKPNNLPALMVGSAMMTPSVPPYSVQFRRTVSNVYTWHPVMPGMPPFK